MHLRKEILLLGELLEKYQEKLREAPSTLGRKQEALFAQAFEGELANMKNKVDASTAEAEATKGKLHELEQSVLKKDLLLAEQKRMMKRIKVGINKTQAKYVLTVGISAIFYLRKRIRRTFWHLRPPTPPCRTPKCSSRRRFSSFRRRSPVRPCVASAVERCPPTGESAARPRPTWTSSDPK